MGKNLISTFKNPVFAVIKTDMSCAGINMIVHFLTDGDVVEVLRKELRYGGHYEVKHKSCLQLIERKDFDYLK